MSDPILNNPISDATRQALLECYRRADQSAAHLAALMKSNPEGVASYLNLELLRNQDAKSTIKRLDDGSVAGYYRFPYLTLEVIDPNLQASIVDYRETNHSRCARLRENQATLR